MTKIYLENAQDEINITPDIEDVIKKSIDAVLLSEDCDFECEVSVSIVDENEIKELNCEHRSKDSITDVLSFPNLEFDDEKNAIIEEYDYDDGFVILGDIVICAKRAYEQSVLYNHSFIREVAFLTVHSMLHLLGYDHEDNINMEQEMFQKQKEILDKMGITRD